MTHGRWRKSSFSTSSEGDCVEVSLSPDQAGIRDSKHTDGPSLTIHTTAWTTFVTTLTCT